MNILQLLMGSQQAAAEVEPEDVVVTGRRFQPQPEAAAISVAQSPLPAAVDNRTAPDKSLMNELIPRKGMFGTKGTLRDVLGLIGDSFLVQAGKDKVYQPTREREKLASAMYGFQNSDAAAMQAVERMNAMGYADQAAKLYDQIQDRKVKQAQVQSVADNRTSQIADRKFKGNERYFNIAANMFRGTAGDPVKFEAAKNALKNLALNNGIEPVDVLGYDLDELTSEQAMALSRGNINVYQQEQLPIQQGRLAVAERQAATGERNAASGETRARAAMINAQKPRAAPRPAATTEASEIARIRQKINKGEKLGKGDQATWNKYTEPKGKKKFGFDPSKVPLPPGFGNIRPVKKN